MNYDPSKLDEFAQLYNSVTRLPELADHNQRWSVILRHTPDKLRRGGTSARVMLSLYILFSALLHVTLGAYVTIKNRIGIRVIQYIGSLFLVASLSIFVYGFAVETPQAVVERPMTRAAIELSLAGVLLHAIAVLLPSDTWRSRSSSNEH